MSGYNAIIISTIVDREAIRINEEGYNAIIISTIVDSVSDFITTFAAIMP